MENDEGLFAPPSDGVTQPAGSITLDLDVSQDRPDNVVALADLATRNPRKLGVVVSQIAQREKPNRRSEKTRKRSAASKYDDLRPLVYSDYRTGVYSDESLRKKYAIKSRGVIPKWVDAGNWKRDLSVQVKRERAILEARENAQETIDAQADSAEASHETGIGNDRGASNTRATPPTRPDVQLDEMSDAQVVQAAALAQLMVVREHRGELKRARELIAELLGELRTTAAIARDTRALSSTLVDIAMLDAGDLVSDKARSEARARATDAVKRMLDVGQRSDTVQKLAAALQRLIPLERLSYGLETSLAGALRPAGADSGRRPFGQRSDVPRPLDSMPLEERIRAYTDEAQVAGRREIAPAASKDRAA